MSDTKDLTQLGSKSTTYHYDEPSREQLETFEYNKKNIKQLVRI